MTVIVKRLMPGQELREQLDAIVREEQMKAGAILSMVGSLTVAQLRLAAEEEPTEVKGPLEIVSATGTLSMGGHHIHLSVSDSDGRTTGGHLCSGCKVRTTVELVIQDFSNSWEFKRERCEQTGYMELKASRRQ